MLLQLDLLLHISKNLLNLFHQNGVEIIEIKKEAGLHNSWFNSREIDRMLELISINYLDDVKLTKWLAAYQFNNFDSQRVVGIVAAGNIPLASFHDVWCALACGYKIQVKLSSKDQILSKYIYEKINSLIPEPDSRIEFVDKLTNIDAMIASGSNLTANHFKAYADRFPCLIRSHRNGIAILKGDETEEELMALGTDVFSYFGLGCRNVTKIYIPDESMISKIAGVFDTHFNYVRDNSRYNNNYEYQHALLSLNRNHFYQSTSILFNESQLINSAIAVLNFEIYSSLSDLEVEVKSKLPNFQCICSNIEGVSMKTSNLGMGQWPELYDYQDEIDVIHFLQNSL